MFKSLTLNSVLGLAAAVLVFAMSCPKAHAAHAHHTADICSATATDICAHLGYNDINTTDAATFMLDLKPSKVDPSLATGITVELLMDMGGHSHGSSPVTLKPLDAAHTEVSKAYFPMAGVWTVKVSFQYAGGKHELSIPLEVK